MSRRQKLDEFVGTGNLRYLLPWLTNLMKLLTISLISTAIGAILCYSCLKTAEQIAKSTVLRTEMSLDQ